MAYYEFHWDDETIEHIAEHGVSVDEFERVVMHPESLGESRSTGHPMAIGVGDEGRTLVCIYELVDDFKVYPITPFFVGD